MAPSFISFGSAHRFKRDQPTISKKIFQLTSIISLQQRGFLVNGEHLQQKIKENHIRKGTHFLGQFQNGQVKGPFWIGLIGGGYIHGVADEHGKATGDNITFIYPDGVTALMGRFENRYMKKANHVNVEEYACNEKGMFFVKQLSQPSIQDGVFFYDPPTNESFGGGWQPPSKYIAQDQYEKKTAYLAPSSIPNSGEGVILKRDLSAGQIACYFSLFLYREFDQTAIYREKYLQNVSLSDSYRRQCKKYSIGLRSYRGLFDLIPEFDVNPLPTLGPKVNHHFKMNNSGCFTKI